MKTNITLTESALQRVLELQQKNGNHNKFLRISVSSGGCSGFQYLFDLDNKINDEDLKILEKNNEIIAVCDKISLPFLRNSTIDFIRDLGASYFKVINPNASSGCGCGASFNI